MVQHGMAGAVTKTGKSDQTSSYSGRGNRRLESISVFGVSSGSYKDFTFKLKNGKKISISIRVLCLTWMFTRTTRIINIKF